MYVNRLELGIFLQQAPSATLPTGWLWSGFKSPSPSPSRHGSSLFSSAHCSAFTHGTQSLPLGHWHLLCRTVSQRAADRAVLYTVRWCRSSCRKISACGLNRSWTQTFNSLSPPCCAWGCLPPLASASRYAPPSSRCRAGRRTPAGDGPDPAANLPLRAAAERLPRYRAADDLGDDEHGENSAIASTIGLADMAAQAGKLLDYSAHAESLPPSPAYVFINAVIMLIMYVVERKVRLPAIWEANNVRF